MRDEPIPPHPAAWYRGPWNAVAKKFRKKKRTSVGNKHEKQFEDYEEWHHARGFAKEYLNTDADGWISPEMDFAKKQEQNRALFNLFTERMAGALRMPAISFHALRTRGWMATV